MAKAGYFISIRIDTAEIDLSTGKKVIVTYQEGYLSQSLDVINTSTVRLVVAIHDTAGHSVIEPDEVAEAVRQVTVRN
jgi:DNA-binding beta-propeller fold protein YncE